MRSYWITLNLKFLFVIKYFVLFVQRNAAKQERFETISFPYLITLDNFTKRSNSPMKILTRLAQ